jgi:hypothetical protein
MVRQINKLLDTIYTTAPDTPIVGKHGIVGVNPVISTIDDITKLVANTVIENPSLGPAGNDTLTFNTPGVNAGYNYNGQTMVIERLTGNPADGGEGTIAEIQSTEECSVYFGALTVNSAIANQFINFGVRVLRADASVKANFGPSPVPASGTMALPFSVQVMNDEIFLIYSTANNGDDPVADGELRVTLDLKIYACVGSSNYSSLSYFDRFGNATQTNQGDTYSSIWNLATPSLGGRGYLQTELMDRLSMITPTAELVWNSQNEIADLMNKYVTMLNLPNSDAAFTLLCSPWQWCIYRPNNTASYKNFWTEVVTDLLNFRFSIEGTNSIGAISYGQLSQ